MDFTASIFTVKSYQNSGGYSDGFYVGKILFIFSKIPMIIMLVFCWVFLIVFLSKILPLFLKCFYHFLPLTPTFKKFMKVFTIGKKWMEWVSVFCLGGFYSEKSRRAFKTQLISLVEKFGTHRAKNTDRIVYISPFWNLALHLLLSKIC